MEAKDMEQSQIMSFHTLYDQYKDIISYAIFGVLTTLVNIAAYWALVHLFRLGVMPGTIIAWAAAVLFAYVTNRKWVFHSDAHSREEISKELISFFSCRFGTGVVDWLCMWFFVDMVRLNDLVIKAVANVIVIILNYIASKLIVFKHREN